MTACISHTQYVVHLLQNIHQTWSVPLKVRKKLIIPYMHLHMHSGNILLSWLSDANSSKMQWSRTQRQYVQLRFMSNLFANLQIKSRSCAGKRVTVLYVTPMWDPGFQTISKSECYTWTSGGDVIVDVYNITKFISSNPLHENGF